MYYNDKKILTQILLMYRTNPVLWDKNDINYRNKEARLKVLQVMLKKFQKLYKNQGLSELRRKIDSMRNSWLREYKKVVESRKRGDEQIHQPTLWYYDLLNFLDPDYAPNAEDSTATTLHYPESENSSEPQAEYLESLDEDEGEDEEFEPAEKKTKYIVVEPLQESLPAESVEDPLDRAMSERRDAASTVESDAFGTMVGLQLQELDKFQRTVAQKLISDIIFYARLNKLTDRSCLSL